MGGDAGQFATKTALCTVAGWAVEAALDVFNLDLDPSAFLIGYRVPVTVTIVAKSCLALLGIVAVTLLSSIVEYRYDTSSRF